MHRFFMTFLMTTLVCAATKPGTAPFAPLVGQHVYACADATLYAVDSPSQPVTRWGVRVNPFGFPRLQPLSVVSVSQTGVVGPIHVITIVLRAEDGRFFGSIAHVNDLPAKPTLASITVDADNHLLRTIPSDIRKEWLSDVQHMLVEKGMNMGEVECSIGMPEHMNDFGIAGIQWVYDGGNTMVYFHDDAVVGVQRIN